MGRQVGVMLRWAARVQAAAELRLWWVSGAPGPVVSG